MLLSLVLVPQQFDVVEKLAACKEKFPIDLQLQAVLTHLDWVAALEHWKN